MRALAAVPSGRGAGHGRAGRSRPPALASAAHADRPRRQAAARVRGSARGARLRAVEDTAVAAYLLNPARVDLSRSTRSAWRRSGSARPRWAPDRRAGADAGSRPGGARALALAVLGARAPPSSTSARCSRIYEDIERPLVPVLALMERHGIRVDPARLEEFAKELERELDNLTREIYELAGEEFTIASPKQLAQILFEKLKLPALRRTKTGYSTDADVLTELAVGHPLPGKVLEHRTLGQAQGHLRRHPAGAREPGHRPHPHHVQPARGGDRTAQLAGPESHEHPDPHRARAADPRGLHPRAQGWRFVAADYSQIELRILAHLSGEPAIIESFQRGEDIHTRTACEVFKVAPEAVSPRCSARSPRARTTPSSTASRPSASRRPPRSIRRRRSATSAPTSPPTRACAPSSTARWPRGASAATSAPCSAAAATCPISRSSNPVARNAAERMAMNAPVQGTASDMIKIAMVRMQAALDERGACASRMLLQVHDELLFEAPARRGGRRSRRWPARSWPAALPLDVPDRRRREDRARLVRRCRTRAWRHSCSSGSPAASRPARARCRTCSARLGCGDHRRRPARARGGGARPARPGGDRGRSSARRACSPTARSTASAWAPSSSPTPSGAGGWRRSPIRASASASRARLDELADAGLRRARHLRRGRA